MKLPDLDDAGDLPVGVHQATLEEITERFGTRGGKRGLCTRRLEHIHALAQRTGHLQRFVVFGSYVTDEPNPNDVDIILVMNDSFRLEACPLEARGLFDHAVAQAKHGASIFWVRPALLIGEGIEEFIAYWQVKRDGSRRGIVEVIS